MTSYLKALLERLTPVGALASERPSSAPTGDQKGTRPSTSNCPPSTATPSAGGAYAQFGSPPAAVAPIDSLTARHRIADVDSSPIDSVSTKCESGCEASGTVECLERADASGLQNPLQAPAIQRPPRVRAAGALGTILSLGILLLALPPPSTAFASSPPEAPTVTVEEPVTANEATLHGILNPGKTGEAGAFELDEYQFLYKASETKACKGGSVIPASPALSAGAGDEELPAETVSGLAAGSEYAVCLRAENEAGEATVGPAVSFRTAEATVPVIEGQSVSEETKNTATVSATINPGGDAATCEVHYGTTVALETSEPCLAGLPAGTAGQAVSIQLKGLQANSEYHYEFFAGNEKGTGQATAQATFKTNPVIGVTTSPATDVRRANALLNGTINPEGAPTSYYFEYGTAPCDVSSRTCGARTQGRGPVSEAGAIESFKVNNLKPGTTYHYWIVATATAGTFYGFEQTFTTAVAEPQEYALEKDVLGPGTNPLEPTEQLKFASPLGVAVNQATGDVYVSDKGASPAAIDQFNAAGEFMSTVSLPAEAEGQATFNITVDNSGVADRQGDVYITDTSAGVVYKFDPNADGELALDATTPKIGEGVVTEPRGVAVNATGDVYVTSASGTVAEFSPAGTSLNTELITGLSVPTGLAVDVAGDIYVATETGTAEYTPTGECARPGVSPKECVPISADGAEAVAVDPIGDVFISDLSANTVKEFGPAPENVPIQDIELERPGVFTGIPRGIAINDTNRTIYAAERGAVVKVFRFLNVKPVVVKTESAAQLTGTVETLRGTVNPGGQEPAEYYFEYGTAACSSESCGTVVRGQDVTPLNGNEAIAVSLGVEGLTPETTYHYRIVGVNDESGVEYGNEETFTTGPEVGPPAPGDQVEHKASPGVEPAELTAYPDLTTLAPVPGPKEVTVVVHPLTRAQKLQKALRVCRKDKKPKTRRACEAVARKHFGPKPKPKKKKH